MNFEASLRVEGYASLFGRPDSAGDVVMAGAFAASLARRPPAAVKMLFQHDPAQPIGIWTDIREDRHGLKASGMLAAGVARAEDIARLIRLGALDGLSIGFRTVRAARDRATGLRLLRAVDLWEISIVTFPLLSEARIMGQRQPAPVPLPMTTAAAIRAAARSFLT
ncbi:HK97 family phage prohead protease [Rhodoligotrophos defluvii]|uniref:HK97 family phage prohead protease n=1 Tax=Rhodoligotrophos defluvii TaxID=2561934 RepID=UPI0010C9C713|nr:HK97 family phage prohead protease [Rhodoligotrophos defluvii]